jgi:copper resistance protein C
VKTAHRGGIAGVVLLWMLLVALGSPAHAHTTLVSSTPADGTQLDAPPSTIELIFSEPVDPRLVTVVVSGSDGAQWQDGTPGVAEAVVSQAVRPLVDGGDYMVAYRVVSADGHPVTGQVRFSVSPAAPIATPAGTGNPTPSAAAAAGSTPAAVSRSTEQDPSGGTGWTYAAIGLPVAALLFAVGMLLARSRARSRGGIPGHGG